MARRVFFHVGLPKSGTTFVQTTMWHNRRALRRSGWLYPGRRRMDHYHAGHEIRDGRVRRPENAGIWKRMVADLADWRDDGLVSHEFLSMATPDQARRAIEAVAPAEVHVVVTARDYVRQFPAVWQEALKMGASESLDRFLDQAMAKELTGAWSWRSQDLPAVTRRWGKWLPPERVHLVTLPPPGAPRGLLWERWCDALGLDDTGFDLDARFDNSSLGAPQVALMQRVVPHLDDSLDDLSVLHRWLRQYLGHEVLGPQRGAPFALAPRHAQVLAQRSTEAADALAGRGYLVHGDLDDLRIDPAGLGAATHPDAVPVEDVLDAAARAIAVMLRDVHDLSTRADDAPASSRAATPADGDTPSVRERVRNRLSRGRS